MPGRAAVLRLLGKEGSLDLFVVYRHTGPTPLADDLDEAGIAPGSHSASSAGLRAALRSRLASRLRPRDSVLSFMGGDYNFVVDERDRFCLSSASSSGARDLREAATWKTQLENPHALHELFQPAMTYLSPQTHSRLDRFYCNQHSSEYLDRAVSCTALGW